MKAQLITIDGDKGDKISSKKADFDLADDIFGLEPRADILHRMVNYQLAGRRQGTHKVKQRAEVAGTTRRLGRQKGSGGARQGEGKAPHFRGGGVAHGPVVRDHAHKLTKKFRQLALKHALSAKCKDGSLYIVEDFAMKAPKTKSLAQQFNKLGLENALLIGGEALDQNFTLSARNIPNIDFLPAGGINVYDIIRRHKLVLSVEAIRHIEERLK